MDLADGGPSTEAETWNGWLLVRMPLGAERRATLPSTGSPVTDAGDVTPSVWAQYPTSSLIGSWRLLVAAEKMTSMAEKQRIEAITVPVADVDRAKAFYERVGWTLDYDTRPAPGMRVVQFTPAGSACSITFGTGMPQAEPGSYRNTYLVVSDIARAHAELVERGIEVSDIYHWSQEGRTPGDPNRADLGKYPELAGPDRTLGVDPHRTDFGSYAEFADPDGNTWLIQEVPSRASTEV